MAAGLYDITNETLGKGHFAVVKLARHCLTGELVAVKIIDKLRLKNENLQPLGQEIRLLSRLSEKEHPNIVKLYQVIDTKYKLYLVMEYSGQDVCDLYDFIQKHNCGNGIREKDAKHIFRQICSAIAYCHSLRIVHRDLKPENILIVNKPEDHNSSICGLDYPIVKLIDFGFSNQWKEGEKMRTSCGSLAYSAPEILLGDLYDGDKVDIWGLGCILYILLYGKNPFMQINDSETLIRILDCSYSAPSRPNINECSISLYKSLLRKDPKSRLSVQQILNHPWLNGGTAMVTEQTTPECNKENNQEDEITSLKRRINSNTILPEKISPIEPSKSDLHDKVIEQMISKSMASSKEQVEAALLSAREYANRAPSRLMKQAKNGDSNGESNTCPLLERTILPSAAGISDNKLINERSNECDSQRLFSEDAYITATYHLLKDKLYREHHGINLTNQIISRTMHHKKVLPSRPRKSIIKPPQFGFPSLRSASEEPLTQFDENEEEEERSSCNRSIKSLELPYEDDAAFTLPLARKCSIVSEEGSCVGADFSGTECGSDSVMDYSNLSTQNFASLDSINEAKKVCKNSFPVVDIIVTDCSTYEEPFSEEDEQLEVVTQVQDITPDYETSISSEASGLCQNDSPSKSQSDNFVFIKEDETAVEDNSAKQNNTGNKKNMLKTEPGKLGSLHMVSSSPDLRAEEFKQQETTELFVQDKEESYADAIGDHLKSHHLTREMCSSSATLTKSSKLHTSLRVITQSKSCNNILIGEEDSVDGKRKKSSKKFKKKESRKEQEAQQSDGNKKSRKDKLECCSIV